MRRLPTEPAGAVHTLWLDSALLKGNLLGDPTRRRVDVYIPAGHDGTGLPLLVDIVGYTAGGPVHTNWKNYDENVPARADRLIASGAMPPVAIAFPDCFTRLGGNQYVNSAAMGPWADVLTQEVLALVEGRFGCGGPGKRGLFGKSSGGHGAILHGMWHGGTVWNAIACHSGDMFFDLIYRSELAGTLRALAKYGGRPEGFMRYFETAKKVKDDDWHTLMMLCQAASFDPDPALPLGIRLPVTQDTCELIPERWANWLAFDPIRVVDDPQAQARLKGLKALFIDCGDIDQYNLVYGARILHRKLTALGIAHRYEEFPDTHSSIDYRMDESLPFLAKALTA